MRSGPPRRRRARPVGDAPIDELLNRSEDLTKGWLLALLERAPLAEAPSILAADLTREGPRVCEALLHAISSDADQRRLEPGGALEALAARVGDLAGASGPEGVSQSVDALQEVLWSALRAELFDPDPELISELAERLAQVTALLRAAALRDLPAVGEAPPRSGTSGRSPALAAVPNRPEDLGADPDGDGGASDESLPDWLEGESGPDEAPALWVGALEEEIQRSGGASLSLLLAELEDAERVLVVESEQGSAATFGEFAQGVRQAVRRQDILVSETATRAWVIARDTGRTGARALAQRISGTVRQGHPWRGAPLTASVGIAVLGEDGLSPTELIEAAEQARFAASASGER